MFLGGQLLLCAMLNSNTTMTMLRKLPSIEFYYGQSLLYIFYLCSSFIPHDTREIVLCYCSSFWDEETVSYRGQASEDIWEVNGGAGFQSW
jgi:hypothetical protein